MGVKWKGGDEVHVRLGGEWVRGRVVREPTEWREGVAVTVDCEDGWRRYACPSRLRPMLRVVRGGAK